jgi:peptidoglycan/LPS O-acetylase OafA/YrhL
VWVMRASLYRPDIDGLRAIAVGLVLAFHAFPGAIRGGFVGVDVFFVISGFLITGIIRDQKDAGTFRLANFYERRIRRIFPALVTVLAASYIASWFLFLPMEFAQLGTNTVAGAAFFANIALFMQAGYFDLEAARKPLLHLWSLGIEEQFYVAWPLLLLIASRFRSGIIWMIAGAGLGSFALNLLLVKRYPEATFYLPFTRAWELMLGAWLTYARIESRRFADFTALLGLVLILAAALTLTAKGPFPGWRAALPVVGTALLISSRGSQLNRTLLASRPMVAIGLISYPLYLWHWPLLVYASAAFGELGTAWRVGILAISVLLAWATWRAIETPIRTGQYGLPKAVSLGAAMASVAALGVWAVQGAGLSWRFAPEVLSILQASQQTQRWRINDCTLIYGTTVFADSCIDRDRRPLLFLWGDSTAAALAPGLLDLQKKRQFGLAQFSTSSCAPILSDAASPYCGAMNHKVFATLAGVQPNIVLLEAIWYPTREHLDALANTVTEIKKLGVPHVVVLGRVPVWEGGLPRHIVKFYRRHTGRLPQRLPQLEREKWYDDWMRKRLEPLGVTFVSAWDALCSPAEGCLVRLPNADGNMDLVATDMLHLSEAGSAFLVAAIEQKLFPMELVAHDVR